MQGGDLLALTPAEIATKCKHNFLFVDDTAGYCDAEATYDTANLDAALYFPLTTFRIYEDLAGTANDGYNVIPKHQHAAGNSGFHKASHDDGTPCTDCGIALICDTADAACEFASPNGLPLDIDRTGAWSIHFLAKKPSHSGGTEYINAELHCRDTDTAPNSTDYVTTGQQAVSQAFAEYTFNMNTLASVGTITAPAICMIDLLITAPNDDVELLGAWIEYRKLY